ncbi:hypothetical protein GWK47_021093 [Chionoecetes opilio]|uniref:Uncharacterized protein n=1 Tax=Chionoecetes opilio TaxID=41210 RepID=A0A8J4XPA1_CHIOP|nr:hypothetical protein GWK47_021093 [Chionoecetes opilio]
MPLLRPEGALLAPVSGLTPQGGARPPTHHSNFTPTSGGSDRWRSGDGGVAARGDQLLTPSRHVSLHSSGGHWGASVCGGSPTVGGPRHIPTSAPGYTHGSHPRCRGQHATPGNHHLSVSVGTVSTTECIYIAEGVQQLYLSLKACKALRLVHHTFPRPLSPPVCVLWSHQTPHKTHVARNRHLTNL